MSELTDDRLLPCPFCGYALSNDEGLCIVPDKDEFGDEYEDRRTRLSGVCCPGCSAFLPLDNPLVPEAIAAWNRRAAASTSTEGAGVKAAADQLLAALQRYGFPVSDAAVRPLMDGGSLEAQAVHVAAMQLRAKLNPPASKVTTQERNA